MTDIWAADFRTRREDCAQDRCPINKYAGQCHLRRGHGGACDPMGESHLEAEAVDMTITWGMDWP